MTLDLAGRVAVCVCIASSGRGKAGERVNYKEEIFRYLKENNCDALLDMFDRDPHGLRRGLTRLTYDRDEDLAGQAAAFFGMLAKKRAASWPEYFREIIRRHLWAMNEESGNMDWRAPEVIAHIVAAEPDLFGEYAPVMIEAALMEPIFYPSLRKAKKILASKDRKLIEYHLPSLERL